MKELSKRKYKKDEVEKLLNSLSQDYNLIISNHKQEIKNLTAKNTKLALELEYYKEKEEAINGALKSAEEKAIEKNKDTDRYYALAVQSLKNFIERWGEYFNALKEKYPLYKTTAEAVSIKEKLENILSTETDNKVAIEKAEKLLPKTQKQSKKFNPQQKINDYIAATADTEFNLDEVLNPGELVLEDLCKELGLIDEN